MGEEMRKKIRIIKEAEIEKEVKAGKVCLYHSRKLGGAFVPEIARKKILKGAEFCFFTDELDEEKPLTEHEKLARAVDDLKKEILETWFGRFMFWILDRLSQMINWVRRKK